MRSEGCRASLGCPDEGVWGYAGCTNAGWAYAGCTNAGCVLAAELKRLEAYGMRVLTTVMRPTDEGYYLPP